MLLTEKTIPGPLVSVSTSVHLFRSRVRNCCTKPSLLTTSKWLFLSTDWYSVDANCCYGCTKACTVCSVAHCSNEETIAECSALIIKVAFLINLTSRIRLIMFDSARIMLTLLKNVNYGERVFTDCRIVRLSSFKLSPRSVVTSSALLEPENLV